MSSDDTNAKLRGHKEIVKGRVVDKQGVHLDDATIEKALLKAAAGNASTEEAEDIETVSSDAELIDGQMVDEDGVHLDKDNLLASLLPKTQKVSSHASKKGKTVEKTANIDLGMYQPIWEELQKIPFSENYEQEIKSISHAVKQAAMEFKVKKIIANTKSVAKNAEKFFYTGDTVRIVFSILGNKFSMAAAGDFTGKEALYIQVVGDNLEGQVLRIDTDGDVLDVTKKYKIGIKRV